MSSKTEQMRTKRKQKTFSWRFKFKHRVATRDLQSGFAYVKEKQNAYQVYSCLFLDKNVVAQFQILFGGVMKLLDNCF